ncbi:uncharacterized protein PV09_08329 [Verruconis gallopava]|uniref:Uncharacterized protein n=1 Tax=Verruconis gallopava TaxID=253628 RepID=A0A0D2A0I5_9PEZI|nr:uncharacterized protein PV09_08329 [Verruconis gallopava]KIW00153.1 hypothetical protein PV09_08329 [Verruconis gallopava]
MQRLRSCVTDVSATSYDGRADEHDHLTEHNLHVFEYGDVAQGSTQPTYPDISKHWDGVKSYNRERIFELKSGLREHAGSKRLSDSSDDYSNFFSDADAATELESSERRNSLKLYKEFGSTALPHERWHVVTMGWPDQAAALSHAQTTCNEELEANQRVEANQRAEALAAKVDMPILEQTHNIIEVDEDANNEEAYEVDITQFEQACRQVRTTRPGKFRIHRGSVTRIRK